MTVATSIPPQIPGPRFRRARVKKSLPHWLLLDYALSFSTLFGAVLVIYRNDFLPERFFLDGNFIRDVARGYATLAADDSFRSAAATYRFFGLADSPTLASLLGFIGGASVVWFARFAYVRVPTVRVTIAFVIAMLMTAVYLGYYSKDVFVLPVVAVLLILGNKRYADVLFIAAAVVYASSFRGYWVLVAALYLVFLAIGKAARSKLRALFAGSLAALVVAGLLLPLLLHVDATHYRDMVNVGRTSVDDAATVISPLIASTSLFSGILNLIAALLGFLVPIPLLRLGGIYYAVIAIIFSVIWFSVGSSIRALRHRELSTGSARFGLRAAALLVAFLTTQALFEPDYGSALRHLTPLLVVVAALVAYVENGRSSPTLRGANHLHKVDRSGRAKVATVGR